VRHCPKRRNAQLQPASAWQVDCALVRRQARDAPWGQRLQWLRCQYLYFCSSKASKLSTWSASCSCSARATFSLRTFDLVTQVNRVLLVLVKRAN
jgi:hypothetical protein